MGSYVKTGLVRYSLHKQRVARTVPGVWRTARPCPSRFRSPTSTLLVFLGCSMALRDPLNRPMRTRMSGDVAGASGRPLPLCRFWRGVSFARWICNPIVANLAEDVGERDALRTTRWRSFSGSRSLPVPFRRNRLRRPGRE